MSIWDKRPDETSKAYDAFVTYRDLGPKRSIAAAYRQQPSKENAPNTGGIWLTWSSRHSWVARAQAYDQYLDRMKRLERERQQLEEITAFRQRARQAAAAASGLAIAVLRKTAKRIEDVDPKEIKVGQIPAFIRATASLLDTGLNAEAQAIGVEQLEDFLNESIASAAQQADSDADTGADVEMVFDGGAVSDGSDLEGIDLDSDNSEITESEGEDEEEG